MPEVVGQVQVVSSKVLSSGTYHSFCVDDTWYRTGNTPVQGLEKGYTIKFTFTKDQWGNQVDMASINFKEGEAPPPEAKKAYTKKSGGNSFQEEKVLREKYWNDKEVRDIARDKKISYAGALNTAIALVGAALDKELVALPKGKNLSLRFEAYKAMVHQEASELYTAIQATPERVENVVEDLPQQDEESFIEDVKPEETKDDGGW